MAALVLLEEAEVEALNPKLEGTSSADSFPSRLVLPPAAELKQEVVEEEAPQEAVEAETE
jgi:hypothetical protein